jgi:AcrR family transcriptional regulator
MSTKPSKDLRSRRTRKWLQEALLILMKDKSFRDIQVTEIADRAEVSRPAFYLHFHSKEELLLSHVDTVFDEFYASLSSEVKIGDVDRKGVSILLFKYWEKHADTLKMIFKAENDTVLLKRLRSYVAIIMADLRIGKRGSSSESKSEGYIVDFVAGGAYMLLKRWIMDDMPYTVEQMGLIFFELTTSCQSYPKNLV